MSRRALNTLVAAVTTMALAGLALCGCATMPNYKDAERYIAESERQWAASVASGDSSVVQRILAEDFVGVDPDSSFYDKATMVAETRDGPKYFLSNELNTVKIRFYGTTAIAQGDESWQRRDGQQARGRFVWTDTWLWRNGQWQIVAAEDLIAPEKAK